MVKLGLALVVALLLPPAAAAHLRSGTVAVDYSARITSAPADVAVGVYQSDRALHMSVPLGHSAVVSGYLGGVLFRVGRSGDATATATPSAAATRLTTHGRSAVWHDVRTSSANWRVPVTVDGEREAISGTTARLPRPSIVLWIAIAAAIGLAAAAIRSPTVAALVSAGAAIVLAAGFALSAYASPGTWIAGFDELAFVGAGFGVLRWGPPAGRLPSVLWLGLVGLAVGLSRGEVFLHALVLSAVPSTLARVLAAVAIGAGVAAAARVGLRYLDG